MDKTSPPTKIWQSQGEQPLAEGLAQQPQVSTPTPSLAPNEPLSSHHGSPQPMSPTPPQTQFIQAQMQPMGMVPQQVMYIPLKYTPQKNYRTISYIVLAAGICISMMLSFVSTFTGSAIFESLTSVMCCGSFTGVVFLDAAYYKGKADWQQANGMANGGSTTSMVIELIIGAILAVLFLLMLLGLSLELL
jgi:hypothetical protein